MTTDTAVPQRGALMIGLATSVVPCANGFAARKAEYDLPLLGDLRWRGFAAGLTGGHASRLIVVGGTEAMAVHDLPRGAISAFSDLPVEGDRVRVPRGLAICHTLAERYAIPRARLDHRSSDSNTQGNIATIATILAAEKPSAATVVLSSSFYHLPRVGLDLHAAGLHALPLVPAEAYYLAETAAGSPARGACRADLEHRFGGGALARRAAGEIAGVADKLRGTYAPRSGDSCQPAGR